MEVNACHWSCFVWMMTKKWTLHIAMWTVCTRHSSLHSWSQIQLTPPLFLWCNQVSAWLSSLYWWCLNINRLLYLPADMHVQPNSKMRNHSTNFIKLLMSNKINWRLKWQTLLMSYICCKLFLRQKLSLNCSHTIGSTEWNKCFSQIVRYG